MRPLFASSFCLLLLVAARPAQASVFDLYGFTARGVAAGNALTAGADDFTATYYNPAGLTLRKKTHFGLGLNWIAPGLEVQVDRPDSEPAARIPEMNLGVHLGLSVPLGGKLDYRLAFGVGIYHPALQFTRVEALDPSRPQFYLYQSLPDKLLIAPAVAFAVTPWLSLGVGLQILSALEGSADARLSVANQRITGRNLGMDLLGEVAPTAGALVSLSEGLRLGVSYRSALDFTYAAPLSLWVEEVGQLTIDIRGTVLYTPHQLSAGLRYRPSGSVFTLLMDCTYAAWSQAPDPSTSVQVSLEGQVLGREQLFYVESLPVALGAVDILIPRFGVEWSFSPSTVLRAGYFFRPTPLPTPTGRSNYIDSDAHTASLGAAWTTADPLETHSLPLIVEVAAQLTWLTQRRVEKRWAGDSVGSYSAGGPIGHLSLTLRHDL